MFERKIEEITALFSRITIGEQDSIIARQINAAEIPQSLKLFFERDIDLWVSEEKLRLLDSAHFVYSDDDVIRKFDSIVEVLPQYARFSALEFRHALDRNVSLLFNYVCRPQWSLVRYFFTDREHVPTVEIERGMKYFWHYEYYRLILTEYFSKKSISVIDARKFEELIKNIDNEITRSFDSKKLASLTEPIFELFNVGNDSETPLVPMEALSIFFDDKGLTSIVEHIDQEKTRREYINMHDLVLLIGDVDFTMSLDISSIVSQHVRALGVHPPERVAHAGRDFEVPSFPVIEQEPVDIADGERHLDFVISDEEQGVIERDFDSLHEADDDDDAENDFPSYDAFKPADETEMDDELREILTDTTEDVPETQSGITEIEEEDDYPAYSVTEESILDLEERLNVEPETEFSVDSDDIDVEPDAAAAPLRDDLDVVAELGLLDDEEVSLTGGNLINDDIEMDILLDDEDDIAEDSADATEPAELDIDWEKEAASIPDLALEETSLHTSSPVSTVPEEKELQSSENLKPAEELLSQLQLDDVDDIIAPPKQQSFGDIPLIENDDFPRRNAPSPEQDAEEVPIPADDVIRQFGDLFQQISVSDQKKYAKKLFRKNDDTVKHALAVLNGKPSWREASEYIDELFIKYDVDMYSRIAVQFTDDVYKRYLPKK